MNETESPTSTSVPSPTSNRVAMGLTLVLLVGLGAATAAMLRGDEEPPEPPRRAVTPEEGDADPGGCGIPDPDKPADIALQLDGDQLDFGDVEQGALETRVVTFRSTGRGPLCIHRVRSGCGCFLAELDPPDKLRFEPGETGRLKITMNSERREGDTHKSVTIYTNRLRGGSVVLRCRANVVKGLILVETAARFRAVPRETPSEATLTLYTPKDEGPFEVLGVEGTRPGKGGLPIPYTFETEVIDDPGLHKVRLVITHPGLAEPGGSQDAIRIRTSHRKRSEITVSSYLQVVDRIRPSVRTASLGLVGPGREAKPVRVWFRPGVPDLSFRLVAAYIEAAPGRDEPADGLGFLATLGTDERGAYVDLRHDGRARRPGLHEAMLVVTTDDPQQRQIRIPLRAEER
ncbi:MAG: DUF1573 domain-containing protein [Planctomycetota bacterium]